MQGLISTFHLFILLYIALNFMVFKYQEMTYFKYFCRFCPERISFKGLLCSLGRPSQPCSYKAYSFHCYGFFLRINISCPGSENLPTDFKS